MRDRALAIAISVTLLAQSTGAADLVPRLPLLTMPPARHAFQPPPPAPAPVAEPTAPRHETDALARVPQEPVVDRMLLKKEPGFQGVFTPEDYPLDVLLRRLRASASGTRPVFTERFDQPWIQGPGLRLRVVYLKPVGVTWGDDSGYHGRVGERPTIHLKAEVPRRWRRSFPLYFAGDVVAYEIEVENTGVLPVPALSLRARQERFEPSGSAGRPLGPAEALSVTGLPLGGRAVVRGSFRLSAAGRAALNFEQTHLVVSAAGAVGERVLLDVPQAGVADPPGR